MQTNKRTCSLLLSLLVFISISACTDDFLEIPPEDEATVASFYKTEADFESAIVGIYSNWRKSAVRPPSYLDFRSDDIAGLVRTPLELTSNDVGPNIGDTWWDLYADLIAPSNILLENIEEVEFDEVIKNRIRGEALFFRGYAYYWLNLAFGGVPLVTSSLSIDESLALGISTEEIIWGQAEADFKTASDLLPEAASKKGKVDKYAAAGFHARALMQQRKWSDAVPVLESIYNNSGHILEDSWDDMWSTDTEDSEEYMLVSIGSLLFDHNDYGRSFLSSDTDGRYLGGQTLTFKPGLEDAFEAGDVRKDMTLGRTPLNNFAENRKYDFGLVDNLFTFDIVALRFSDIVLMYAEAISMAAGSPQQQSLDLINETRNRAGLDDLVLADVPTQEAFIDAVLTERRLEHVWEGTRYPDLKRHNLLLEKVNALGDQYSFGEEYLTLPIPQRELDKYPPGVLD